MPLVQELALIVPRGEKLALAAVAEEALRKEQGSKQWKREGRLSEIGQEAMDTLTPWAKDIDFVEALLSDGGVMSVIVGLCDATDLRSCPDQQFTETLISISRNCSLSLRVKAQENDDSSPLLPLVKSGALAKVIKFGCVGHPEMAKEADEILDMVRLDLRLVRKHFKRGGELYEALTAAVNSQKSRQYPKLRETMNHLLGTHLMQTHTVSPGHMCRTCSAEEQPGIKMLACAKCR